MTTLWLSNLSFTSGSDEFLLVRQFGEIITDEQGLGPTAFSIVE